MPSSYVMVVMLSMEVVIPVVFTPLILGSTPVIYSRLSFTYAAAASSASVGLLSPMAVPGTICYESRSMAKIPAIISIWGTSSLTGPSTSSN